MAAKSQYDREPRLRKKAVGKGISAKPGGGESHFHGQSKRISVTIHVGRRS